MFRSRFVSIARIAMVCTPVLGVFFLSAGCGDEEVVEVIVPPAITASIESNTTSVATGEPVSLRLVVDPGGPDYTVDWTASGGTFTTDTPDSAVWLSPDVPGLYSLAATVTDGDDVGLGKIDVAVGAYIPEHAPFYVGAVACALCHDGGEGGDQYGTWSQSAHATAFDALVAIGQDDNPNCTGCHTVGTNGFAVDAALNNGGYDETKVERLWGVQCENCHKPGSEHPSEDFGSVAVSIGSETCGDCHNGEHHPTFDEWQSSGHAHIEASPAGRASCAKCHNGLIAGEYLDDPEGFVAPTTDPTEQAPIACAVCHDPHGNDNPASLRDASVTDRALPNAVLVESAGAGRLCMACHNGRRTEGDVDGQIENGGRLGPHHSVQGDMLAGVNAYEKINESFDFRSSLHIQVEDACVTCHTHPHEGDIANGIPTFTGHSFEPTVEACTPCHGGVEDFDQILAKQDYDGDGTIEGVQSEVAGLLDVLRETVIAASTSQEAIDALTADFAANMGSATLTTKPQRAAAYNWAYVSFDGSTGVHNTTYAVQLLQQSILSLDPGGLSRAYILVDPQG